MFAIAAMSRNRVIGNGGAVPWHIPEDFKWFRRMTFNSVVIMGRRTFEGLGKPLVGRINVVLTRHPKRLRADERFKKYFADAVVGPAAHRLSDVVQLSFPKIPRTQVRLVRGMDSLRRAGLLRQAWLTGGGQLYEQFLAECSDLYLTLVDREVEGDTFFPPFEHLFDLVGTVAELPGSHVLHYRRNEAVAATASRSWTGR
jgi:dihydrofolate reductase